MIPSEIWATLLGISRFFLSSINLTNGLILLGAKAYWRDGGMRNLLEFVDIDELEVGCSSALFERNRSVVGRGSGDEGERSKD